MSDTPISDSTAHNVADLGMLCRRLERELNADNNMFKKLNIHALNLADRVKRLEEAGDAMADNLTPWTFIRWTKAKEDKP